MRCKLSVCAFVLAFMAPAVQAAPSVCYGTVSKGRLEHGVRLPAHGKNFTAYSPLGVSLGRTYVHSKVADIVLAAYEALQTAAADKLFVYGESGWARGGRFRPHRSHMNGLSVDFMVPVVGAGGISVTLPGWAGNQFGYGIEFDARGRYGKFEIDIEALAEHLYQLDVAARMQGAGIAMVIFDPQYLSRLFATRRGEYVKTHLKFMQGRPWVRHDEHYHVDFAVPCRPLPG